MYVYIYIYMKKLNGSHQTRNISQLCVVRLGLGNIENSMFIKKKKTVYSLIYEVCFPFIYYKEHVLFFC